ncbi:HIRAN domain-containing protein [Rhizobium mongolense]|uniref:HIRAN domain-containing protein n=1 Tax=Rhizobium mongolense TaxID=57676 RepID=UPI0034A42876
MRVVGELSYQDALIAICGRHTRRSHEGEYQAAIEREPTNPHDPNAIVVKIAGRTVGYLPREQHAHVGVQMLEAGIGKAECRARVRGGWRTNQHDEGHYGVCLAIPNWGWIDFGIGAKPPAREQTSQSKSKRPTPSQTGPLRGHAIAIMGAPNDGEIALELARAGARIMASVGKSTTILVVAAERPFELGVRRSASFVRAETLVEEGADLKILSLREVRALTK